MLSTAKDIDPRIIPTVRTLKESIPKNNIEKSSLDNKTDSSSMKTNDECSKEDRINTKRQTEKLKHHMIQKKISIDGSVEQSIKQKEIFEISKNEERNKKLKSQQTKSFSKPQTIQGITKLPSSYIEKTEKNQNELRSDGSKEKIQIYSKAKTMSGKNGVNIKTTSDKLGFNSPISKPNRQARMKFVQSLMNDLNLKKYKQSCINMLKNDNEIKELYNQCGFERTNVTYENIIEKQFFQSPVFMYKLEFLFLDESNFSKKNFKENFFKEEIRKHLNKFIFDKIYNHHLESFDNIMKDTFKFTQDFELYHD